MLQSKSANLKKQTAIYLGLIITLGLILDPFWGPKSVPDGASHRHTNEK